MNHSHHDPHSHTHGHAHSHTSTHNIQVAFFVNLGFALLEIIGGLLTNSMAILSDALHDLGDSLSLGMSWYLENYSRKGEDRRYSYGYRRFSLLSALLNVLVLIGGSLVILSEAVPRLIRPEHSNAQGMVVFAIAGVAINGLAALRLRGGRSLNTQVAAWHLVEDVLGWAAILVVSLVLLVWDIHILDPILSILITLYVLWNVIRNLRRTLSLFLQAVPENMDLEEIENQFLAMPGVESVHHTHLWSLDGEHHVLTTHVVVPDCFTRDEVLNLKRQINTLTGTLDIEHTTVEVEYSDEECRMNENGKNRKEPLTKGGKGV